MTIVASWPKNHVIEPDAAARLHYFLADNPESVVAVIGLTVILGYYLLAWAKIGKDPEAGVIAPLYQAPPGFSPASMRFIKRMGYDHKTFAAAVINLAVKGHLNIEEGASGKFVLSRKQSGAALAPGEKALLNKLFSFDRQFIELKNSNHKQLKKALQAHKKSLQRNYQKLYFLTNSSYLAPGLVFTVATPAIMMIVMPEGAQIEAVLFFLVWLSIWSIAVLALCMHAYRRWKTYFSNRTLLTLTPALINTLFAIPFALGEVFGLSMLAREGSFSIAITLPLLALINYGFYQWLKAPTLAGRKVLDKFDGLQLYLSVAEKDELNFLHPPQKTPQLFEHLLPYALALDVEQQWSEKFADILQQASLGSDYQPRWYHSSHHGQHDFTSFASTIGGSMATAIASSSTAPGSRSGGGGGFSGGGGGGGGGGGW
nr:DUF2207 domain-containing protein [Methylomarinum sp. Ch1-1]MDP4521171.1 DUF2207 domain-containing protein [Methylomarinum sp. Ch1-1]